MIAVVGAGLAGLACALSLQRAGRPFVILEAANEPGGRVRSTRLGGFTLDFGFQVFLDSYEPLANLGVINDLEPCYFRSGALLWDDGKFFPLRNPLRHPAAAFRGLTSPAFPLMDKLRLASLGARVVATSDEALRSEFAPWRTRTTREDITHEGFSETAFRRFFEPFFGGVFLDESLSTNAGLFRFYLKKFALGRAFVPARGVGELPRRLAATLPADSLRLGSRVEAIVASGETARALVLSNGEQVPFTHAVLATSEPATCRLLGAKPPDTHTSTVVAYFSSESPLYDAKFLVLPAGENRLVRHFVQITNIAPEYAPPGSHLLSATILTPRGLSDAELMDRAREEIATVFPAARSDLTPVAILRIPYATRAAGVGPLPLPVSPWRNISFAGDQTSTSSIDAAIRSGEAAAQAIPA